VSLSDGIALCALVFSVASVAVTVFVYRAQTRASRAAGAMTLHHAWWSGELEQARSTVWPLVEEWDAGGGRPTAVICSYLAPSGSEAAVYARERRAIARIAFFFADLNAMLDVGLVEPRFAYRLFGRAQFEWWAEFLLAIADVRDASSSSIPSARQVRWMQDVRALNDRFLKMRADERD
jgi:hypothetical protein